MKTLIIRLLSWLYGYKTTEAFRRAVFEMAYEDYFYPSLEQYSKDAHEDVLINLYQEKCGGYFAMGGVGEWYPGDQPYDGPRWIFKEYHKNRLETQ